MVFVKNLWEFPKPFQFFLRKVMNFLKNFVGFSKDSNKVWDAGQYSIGVQELKMRKASSRSMWDFLVNRGDVDVRDLQATSMNAKDSLAKPCVM